MKTLAHRIEQQLLDALDVAGKHVRDQRPPGGGDTHDDAALVIRRR